MVSKTDLIRRFNLCAISKIVTGKPSLVPATIIATARLLALPEYV
jgi:hypothetical protein